MTRTDKRVLSDEQAFKAMRWFLQGYWERASGSLVSEVLSDTQQAFLVDSITADPAAWNDWVAAVDAVLAGSET